MRCMYYVCMYAPQLHVGQPFCTLLAVLSVAHTSNIVQVILPLTNTAPLVLGTEHIAKG